MERSALLGIVLLLLMVSSSFIYFFSSVIFQPTLPEGNIVDYELNIQQKNLVLRQGRVLMGFFHGNGCEDCQEKISFLEDFANEYKDQLFLQKISINESVPKLHFIGFNITEDMVYLQEKLLEGGNITKENVIDVLCEIMLRPPLECAGI